MALIRRGLVCSGIRQTGDDMNGLSCPIIFGKKELAKRCPKYFHPTNEIIQFKFDVYFSD